jgi:hypothetical protein
MHAMGGDIKTVDTLRLLTIDTCHACHACCPRPLQVRKKRYTKMQEERAYWSKKKTGRKTDNERKAKPHHRPKH